MKNVISYLLEVPAIQTTAFHYLMWNLKFNICTTEKRGNYACRKFSAISYIWHFKLAWILRSVYTTLI